MDSTETRLHDAKLGAAIENAAGKLPEDWQVCITVMKGGYSVGLIDPFGNDYELNAEESLVDDINNAVAEAIAADDEQ
jgi:hypothetical protein